MNNYLVILKIYRTNEDTHFYDTREFLDIPIHELIKKITLDCAGMKYDILQITLIS